ncbi:MAG: YceI family protein [Candidatus Zixiibacteriota bacterium]
MKRTVTYSATFCVIFCVMGVAQAEEFAVDPTAGTDTVYFRSTAKLEFIEGKTNNLTGSLTFEPTNPSAVVSGILQVDLRTLKTGIETRDRHMRENHLHTEKYPFAYFELTGVIGLPATLKPDTVYKATAQGYFYIHGNKRRLSADIQASLKTDPGDVSRLVIRANFAMNLDEYKIDRPKALFLKLAETILVEVIFSARNDLKSSPISLPAWELLR